MARTGTEIRRTPCRHGTKVRHVVLFGEPTSAASWPGYTEAIYERNAAIAHETQVPVTIAYRGVEVGSARLDLPIGSRLVVEIKAVEQLAASAPL